MVANTTLARTAWIAQGGGSTVTLNGRTVEVFPAETVVIGDRVPGGAPTMRGMYVMLGCGDASWTVSWSASPCASLPGVLLGGDERYLAVWNAATSSSWSDTYCYVGYRPGAGHDLGIEMFLFNDQYWSQYQSSDAWFQPVSSGTPGGC
jgi:hypothetical protein